MKNVCRYLYVLMLGAISSSVAAAGPFGLDMGMQLQQIDSKAKKVAPGLYTTKKVPKPHSAFEMYAVKIGPNSGLCWIKAIGKDITTSVYGLELKLEFEEMKKKLEQTYGISKTTDMLMPGSIWDEPKDFMMAILKQERYLMAGWDKDGGASLPQDIREIGLLAQAENREKAYLILEYYFSNKADCDTEIASKEDSVL